MFALCNSTELRAAQPLRDTLSRLNASAVNHKSVTAATKYDVFLSSDRLPNSSWVKQV